MKLKKANFGAKYQQHVKKMQMKLNEYKTHIGELEKLEKQLDYELDENVRELASAKDAVRIHEDEKTNLQSEVNKIRKEISKMKYHLTDLEAVCIYIFTIALHINIQLYKLNTFNLI